MAHIFGVLVAGGIAGPLFHQWLVDRESETLAVASVTLLALSPFIWRTAGEAFHQQKREVRADTAQPVDCRSAEAFAALSNRTDLRVLAPIDLGAPLLLHTSHKVYAAPYHRNAQGIALALDIFSAPPAEARVRLTQLGAQAVAFCPGMNEAKLYRKLGPDGLGVALNDGDVPDWLESVTDPANTVQLYLFRQ